MSTLRGAAAQTRPRLQTPELKASCIVPFGPRLGTAVSFVGNNLRATFAENICQARYRCNVVAAAASPVAVAPQVSSAAYEFHARMAALSSPIGPPLRF
jgi:hypothetical protein